VAVPSKEKWVMDEGDSDNGLEVETWNYALEEAVGVMVTFFC